MSVQSAEQRLFGAVVRPLQAFLRLQAASGIFLLLSALAALVWANLHGQSYAALFVKPHFLRVGDVAASFSLRALINDGLMTFFFFAVGLEVKRELVIGELDTLAKASLPAIGALGGMILPAGIFLLWNWGRPGERGWGIPMATDIAFCVGILTLLKDRIPHSLVVFLTALAIFDDIGGIMVIAVVYGHGLDVRWLLPAAGLCLVLLAMNRQHVGSGIAYALVGVILWYVVHHGGIHAPIAGVIVGLFVPAQPRRPARKVLDELYAYIGGLEAKPPDEALDAAEVHMIEQKLEQMRTPLSRLVHRLHPVVSFVIMPLFALANAGVPMAASGLASLASPVTLGTGVGLFVGKQAGIFGLTLLAVRLRLAPMPSQSTLPKLFGTSILAGVGFTVALFIADVAFEDNLPLLNEAKLGILLGSLAAGALGLLVLGLTRTPKS